MLVVSNLSKSFGSLAAVKNVSFKIDKGKTFTLIGPNGAGKSTIVKIITGLLKPTSGTVSFNKTYLHQESEKFKSMVGYVPDDPVIWNALTGEEFLHFTGALYNLSPAQRLKKIPGLLEEFELSGTEKSYFENYSRGNKQKFAILAALLHKPKLLVIDEPTSGLDPKSIETLKELLKEYTKNGGSVLLVTHTLAFAEDVSSRIGVIIDGELVYKGTMASLRKEAQLTKMYSLDDIYIKLTEQQR